MKKILFILILSYTGLNFADDGKVTQAEEIMLGELLFKDKD
ncbi:hypothetical protein [uncultured Nitrosomonas sp.]|nr:hypothetical protein [uncultured Nitrosomonas sp.]